MSEWCARTVTMLALVPLVSAICFFAGMLSQEMQIVALAGAASWLVAVFLLWHRYVRWSVLRGCSTLGVAAIVLVQVIAWVPAVQTSCYDEEVCVSQSCSLLGASTIAWCALWWGSGRTARPSRPSRSLWRWCMRPDAVRLTVGIAMCPFLLGLWWFVVFVTDGNDPDDVAAAYTLCAVAAAAVWLPLWRGCVIWSPGRLYGTMALTAALLISPALAFIPESNTNTLFDGGVYWLRWCGPMLVCAIWLAGTAWLWHAPGAPLRAPGPSAQQDVAEPTCPHCGYSLRGLTAVRCPECGWTSTIDDVVRRTLDDLAIVP